MTKHELIEDLRKIKDDARRDRVTQALKRIDKLIEDVEEEGVLDVQQPGR